MLKRVLILFVILVCFLTPSLAAAVGGYLMPTTKLTFTEIYFDYDEMSIAVYSGPGKYYSYLSTVNLYKNNPTYVAGFDGEWVLILYYYNNSYGSHSRVGYVNYWDLKSSILPKYYLQFDHTDKRCKERSWVSNDPIYENSTITTIESGTPVTVLASFTGKFTTWAYVETIIDQRYIRGFIPADVLN